MLQTLHKCSNRAAIKQTNTLINPQNIPFCVGDIQRWQELYWTILLRTSIEQFKRLTGIKITMVVLLELNVWIVDCVISNQNSMKEWEDHTKETWFFSDKKLFECHAHHLERTNHIIKMSYAMNILPSRNRLANCFIDTNRTTKQNMFSERAIKMKHHYRCQKSLWLLETIICL